MKDRPAVPAEQEALDRPWRVWASVAIVTFVAVSVALGFLVLPQRDDPDLSLFGAICRAIGIPGYGATRPEGPGAGEEPMAASLVAWSPEIRSGLNAANRENGAQIAAEICVSCHGEDGIAIDPIYPNLAHQSPRAIFKQLQDYADGRRTSGQAELMMPFAQQLDEQQRFDVAVHYATQHPKPQTVAASAVGPAITQIARHGHIGRGIPACDSCHGIGLTGPEETPVLNGQPRDYLEQQLTAFASGERDNDIYARMREIARLLTPDEIRQLAIYYSGKPETQYKPHPLR